MSMILEEYIKKGKFPVHINNKEGEELKKEFLVDENVEYKMKEAKRRYKYEEEDYRYTLLEEILFDETDNSLDYTHVIGRVFYLSRKKIN